MTVDPANNFVHGNPFFLPTTGGYNVTANIDFTGRQYVFSGAFEINQDLVFGVSLPGTVLLRYLNLNGPPLDPTAPYPVSTPYPLVCGGGFPAPCAFQYPATADPASPAFPGPLPVADFSLYFVGPGGGSASVRVVGTDPQVVPEPTVVLLLATGIAGLWVTRKLSFR